MRTNIFEITKFPDFILAINDSNLSNNDTRALFKADIPHVYKSGKIYFLGEASDLVSSQKVEKINFEKLDSDLRWILLSRAFWLFFKEQGLIDGRKGVVFAPARGIKGLNVKIVEANKLYEHDALEYRISSLLGKEKLIFLPSLVVTSDGYRYNHDFSQENSYKVVWKWTYQDFLEALTRWIRFTGNKIRIDLGSNGALETDLTGIQVSADEQRFINEPQVSFHQSSDMADVWPLAGLKRYHPLDYNLGSGKRKIKMAYIGTKMSFGLLKEINRGVSNFPGFSKVFKSELEMGRQRIYLLDVDELQNCLKVSEAKKIYLQALQKLQDSGQSFDLILVELPEEISHLFSGQEVNLRDYLKVAFLEKGVSTQIITPKAVTSTDSYKYPDLALGIYVSAGGKPWKLQKQPIDTCFIGISFGIKRIDSKSEILVGVAELFDEYGESVSIRCVSDKFKKEKGYHLPKDKFEKLIRTLLDDYYKDLKQLPKYVVVHKTSHFDDDELNAQKVLKDMPVEFNFVYISTPKVRLIPDKNQMPKRGDCWIIDENTSLLYTDGFVGSAGMYLGRGTPTPFLISKATGSLSLDKLVEQIMQLTKLNWNSTKNHERSPATISHARKIVNLLRAGLEPKSIVSDFRFYL